MKTRTKLSALLLAGTAVAVLSTSAQADELANLKAQLEALQSRVNTLESQPAPALPSGQSLLTFERGQGSNNWSADAVKDGLVTSNDGGFTIGVTPTADLPAPVAEVTVYGYVALHANYDFDGQWSACGDCNNSFSASQITGDGNDGESDHIALGAFQSRFGIKSKIDTAVGQIRTQIEGDFMGNFDDDVGLFRLRHAVGHWDMTPNWTFTAGQYWMTAALLPIGVSTVDFAGALLTYSRRAQVRLTYTDGPLSWAVAIEEPELESTTNMPNFAAYIQYDIAGGHQIIITGEVADWDGAVCGVGCAVLANDELAWAIQGGANFNLADIATLTMGVGYGEGLLADKFNFEEGFNIINTSGDPLESLAFVVGLSFGLSETTSFNAQFSYVESLDDQGVTGPGVADGDEEDKVYKVHANILWQPVKQMRMGWEVVWAQKEFEDGDEHDAIRLNFGTFFFF